jgi:Gas vesicle protein G
MSLLTFPFRLPLLPVRALVNLASVIADEAEREMADPATLRRKLEDAEQALASGEISEEQAADFQDAAFAEFAQARRSAAAASSDGG